MPFWLQRGLCVPVGYVFGSFLTAVFVARLAAGTDPDELGSGNPGMASIAKALGRGWGAAVLLGDIAKTALACAVCQFVLFPTLGYTAALYAGLGAVLGHDYPMWRGWRGGKGVAVTCTFLAWYAPVVGVACCLVGWALVALRKNLALGGVAIPLCYALAAAIWLGPEPALVALAAFLLMLLRFWPDLRR